MIISQVNVELKKTLMKTIRPMNIILFGFILFISGCENQAFDSADNNMDTNYKYIIHSHTKKYNAEVATQWFNLLTDLAKVTPYNPPQSTRIFAYSSLALYESVVPGMPSYQSIYKYLTGNEIGFESNNTYYWPAVANAAMARISTSILGDYPQPVNQSAINTLEANLNTKFQSEATQEQLMKSIDFGKNVADVIYNWSTTDGTLNSNGTLYFCPPYTPVGGPENWVPTPPFFFPAAGACQGDLRTFVPNIVNLAYPIAAPSYSTDPNSDFYKMNLEIYNITKNLSPTDLTTIQAWRDILGTNYNTPSHVLKLTSNFIGIEKINLEDASIIFAKQSIAMFDAIAATFYAKFDMSLLRPVTYIQNIIDPTWNSVYPTPQHPSYPAIAPSAAAAAVVIWEDVFGENYNFVDDTQSNLYGNWSYSSFKGLLEDVGRSRSHSGLNFVPSVESGINQGTLVGEMVNALPFKKVD